MQARCFKTHKGYVQMPTSMSGDILHRIACINWADMEVHDTQDTVGGLAFDTSEDYQMGLADERDDGADAAA